MLEQQSNQVMSLDCIENVEQINDLAAETISAGYSFKVASKLDGEAQNEIFFASDTGRLNINDPNETIELKMFNNSHGWEYFDVSLHDANTNERIAYTHRSNFGAHGKKWTPATIAHDEIHQYNLYHRKLYLNIVKK